ncbi:MAG: flagellin lysine-N-methylase [Oscillospiraceae bacterium]|nr:flagellin lysine-N-methylase [Oscillospiraceae bacterium]
MIYRYPSYCRSFKCIADKCTDSCCIGWEIDIDPQTLARYKAVDGALGEKLRRCTDDSGFILTPDERCPFLDERGLCELILSIGEDSLCRICTEHPRYYEWFDGVKEGGIGLCCEAAAELILKNDHVLCCEDIPDEEGTECDNELFELLCKAREDITAHIMQDELSPAMRYVLGYAAALQDNIDSGEYSLPENAYDIIPAPADIKAMIDFLSKLEAADSRWIPYISDCALRASEKHVYSGDDIYLKRIAVYFIYRYFLKGVSDGEILSKVRLAVISTGIIGYLVSCSKTQEFCDILHAAKNYSKEIEYSSENLEALYDAFYDKDIFSASAAAGLFEAV